MKKSIFGILATASLLALSLGLIACGDGADPGDDKGTRYSIQAPAASDVFGISGLPDGAYEGDTVTFTVTLANPDDSVVNYVEIYGSEMKYKRLEANADGSYSFTMPGEPVTVTVSADCYRDNETDNFLSWNDAGAVTAEIWIPHFDGDSYYAPDDDVTLGTTITKQPSQSPSNFALTEHKERVFSLDQDVIPDDALSIEIGYKDGTQANRFDVKIDTSKVKAGTTKIVLVVENGHKFGDEAVLVRTVTVTEREPYTEYTMWTEEVTFDISAIENDENTEKMSFVFEVKDYTDDMYLSVTQMFDLDELTVNDGKVVVNFKYAAELEYTVSLHYYMNPQPSRLPDITLGDSSDGAEFDETDMTLSFTKDNGSIELILKQ